MADISHWSKLAQNAYGDNYNTKGYTVNDYMYGTKAAQGNHNWFGLPKANNLFSKGNIGNTMSYAATAASPVITNAISNGYSTNGIGEGISNVGNSIGTAVGGPLGAVISAGSGILGGLTNRFFGIKAMQANIDALRNSITNAYSAGNAMAGATDTNSFMAAASQASGSMGFRPGDLYKGGTFRKEAAERKGNAALDMAEAALAAQGAGMRIGASSIDKIMDTRAQVRYNALGGYLGNPFNPNNMGALGIMQQDAYVDAINNRSNAMYGRRNNGVYAFGGELGTNGADFTNGLLQINAGGLHETNPYQGVQMGVDAQGTPNLVEEGETVFGFGGQMGDYVFSNRMKVPETLHKHFGLGGRLKDGITFADASKKIAKESEERPNDPISIAGLNETLARLAEVQEAERQREQAEEVINGYALGGPKSSPTSRLGALRRMRENQEEIRRLNAGQEVFTPTPGRFGGGEFNGSGSGGVFFDTYEPVEEVKNDTLWIPFEHTFNDAFAEARKQGLKEFDFNGKRYNTELGDNPDNYAAGQRRKAVDLLPFVVEKKKTKYVPSKEVNDAGGKFAQGGLMGNMYAGRGNRSQTLRRTGLPLTVPERISLGIQPDNVFGTVVPEIPVIPSDYAGSLPVVLDNGYPRYGRYNMEVEVDNNFIPDLYPEVARDISVPAYETPFNVNRYGRVNMGYYPDNNFAIDIPEIPAVGGVTGSSLPNNVRTQSAFRVNPYGRVTLGVHPGIPDTVPEDAAVEVAKEPEVLSPSVANVARSSQAALDVNPYGRVTLGVNMANPAREFNTNIYDQGYYNRWRLTAGRNRQGGNRPAATSPAANAPSQASNAEAPQGRVPDYNALATQELNPFNTNMNAVPDKIGMVNGTPVSLYSSRVKAAEEALRNQTPGLNTSAQQTLGTATSPFQGNSEDDENDVTKYATWPRYAPPFFNGLMVATDALGLTNKGDYSSADKIEAAANALGYTPSIAPEPVGNYMKYIPMDITYGLNQLAAQSNAANRGLENVAGTRGAAMAGIIANSNNAQTATGNMYRQALEYNDALQKQVEAFNSDIDKFSSQMSLEAAIANARYRQAGRQLRLAGLGQAASLREAIDQRLGAAKSANLTNFVNSLGNIGRENFIFNQINASSPANNNYGIERSGSTTHKGKSMLKSKKDKNTKKNGGNR